MKKIAVIFLCLLPSFHMPAQSNPKIDSLTAVLKTAKEDTSNVKTLNANKVHKTNAYCHVEETLDAYNHPTGVKVELGLPLVTDVG